ncbi:MAG: hypothetical protein BJ554DRAFT_6117, partial [Olpidium bornovanus]
RSRLANVKSGRPWPTRKNARQGIPTLPRPCPIRFPAAWNRFHSAFPAAQSHPVFRLRQPFSRLPQFARSTSVPLRAGAHAKRPRSGPPAKPGYHRLPSIAQQPTQNNPVRAKSALQLAISAVACNGHASAPGRSTQYRSRRRRRSSGRGGGSSYLLFHVKNADMARHVDLAPRQRPQKSGLAHAVAPDEPVSPAVGQGEGCVCDYAHPRVRNVEILDLDVLDFPAGGGVVEDRVDGKELLVGLRRGEELRRLVVRAALPLLHLRFDFHFGLLQFLGVDLGLDAVPADVRQVRRAAGEVDREGHGRLAEHVYRLGQLGRAAGPPLLPGGVVAVRAAGREDEGGQLLADPFDGRRRPAGVQQHRLHEVRDRVREVGVLRRRRGVGQVPDNVLDDGIVHARHRVADQAVHVARKAHPCQAGRFPFARLEDATGAPLTTGPGHGSRVFALSWSSWEEGSRDCTTSSSFPDTAVMTGT